MNYTIGEATYDDAAALADIIIQSNLTTFRGLVPDQCLTGLTWEESRANWQRFLQTARKEDEEFLHVATTETGLVVGVGLGGPQADEPLFAGELYLLNVLPAFQGQGIGRQLVRSVAVRLTERSIGTMGVRVLMVNPHRRFYEHLNAQYLREEPYDWNGVILRSAVYCWPDTTRLLNNAQR
jgi:ribosomal protein S18 acetylase RimI-like enzyme